MNGFVDVETLLIIAAEAHFTGLRAGVTTPANLQTVQPFLQIYRVGGPVVGVRTDRAIVRLNYFAADRPTANDGCAAAVWWLLHTLPGAVVALPGGTSGVITQADCPSGPSGIPDYGDPNTIRVGATCSLIVQTLS